MPTIEVNGEKVHYNVSPYNAKNGPSYYKRIILDALRKIGITEEYIDLTFGGGMGYTSVDGWAEVVWYVNGKEHKYRCSSQGRSVDNIAAISQVIEQDSKAIRRGLKSFGQVMNQFQLEHKGGALPKTPRQVLGIQEGNNDLDFISFKYKQAAKNAHSDKGGSDKKMQELNEAYEDLKKEVGT